MPARTANDCRAAYERGLKAGRAGERGKGPATPALRHWYNAGYTAGAAKGQRRHLLLQKRERHEADD
jgi:hypothetical protein